MSSNVQNFEKPLFISCTPFNDTDRGSSRFMRLNAHGMIRHFKREDSNQINVQWWQTEVHPSIEFPNDKEYSHADLSSNAVLFASSKLLHCVHFDQQFEENEWSLHLNKGEQIRAVCLGDRFIAVATNNRNLRFFSLNGTQHQLISIPGPIQCLIASNKTVVAVYHRMLPLPENQSLAAMILEVDLEFKSIVNLEFSPINLAITEGSILRWIGFTDEGTLSTFDSSGSLKLFKSNLGFNWIEIANLYQQVDNKCRNIFIISISDFVQEIRCVLCFKSRYPLPEQVPVIQNLKFKLNLCKVKGKEIDELEERNILSNVKCTMLNSLADHDIDTGSQIKEVLKQQVDSLFKIFQDAGKSNNEMRQLDSAKLIPSLKTIENLIKYSEQSRLVSLVPKLNELVENKRTDRNDQIDLFTALPTKQSSLQKLDYDCLNDEITPLIIDKSALEKQFMNESSTDGILDRIEPSRYDDIVDLDNATNAEEEDDLLKMVTTDVSANNLKNPFKI